jgi:hypothetical protein
VVAAILDLTALVLGDRQPSSLDEDEQRVRFASGFAFGEELALVPVRLLLHQGLQDRAGFVICSLATDFTSTAFSWWR